MKVNMYNGEHYYDPTAYEALSEVIRKTKIYVRPKDKTEIIKTKRKVLYIRYFTENCEEVTK